MVWGLDDLILGNMVKVYLISSTMSKSPRFSCRV